MRKNVSEIKGIPKFTVLLTKKVENERAFYEWLEAEGIIRQEKPI